jgi:ABC-type nitrate/sulfonate/bicarbonate transport system substrate-binding protein
MTWAFVFLCAGAPTYGQSGLEKINIGYSAQAGAYAPIWITKDAGLFNKNGLDANLIFIPGGPTAAAAMVAGEMQAVAMAGPAIVSSNLAGSDLVMIAGIVNTFAFQLVTVKNVRSAGQLKGKRIGVNRFGAAPDVAARYALKHLGIDARDVTILQLGEQSTRLAAMKAGQLEAAILLPPITTLAQKEGMNILLDMSNLEAEFQITGLASSRSFVTQKKPSALKLMRSFVDTEAINATYEYFADRIVPKKPYPSIKGVKALLELAAKDKPEAVNIPPERFVNLSLLKELDERGFIDRLYR